MATLKFWNSATEAWEYVPSAGNASYSGTVPSGSATVTINHGLGTTAIAPQCFRTATGEMVLPTYTVLDADRVQLTFAAAPAAGEYRVVIISAIPNESPVGRPVATHSWAGGSSVLINATTYDTREVMLEHTIPDTAGRYIEAVLDCSGYFYNSSASTVSVQLEVSEDGGATWSIDGSSRQYPPITGGETFGDFSVIQRYAGTPSSDLLVRLTAFIYAGNTGSRINGANTELVAQIFSAEPVVLDNRYIQQGADEATIGAVTINEAGLSVTGLGTSVDARGGNNASDPPSSFGIGMSTTATVASAGGWPLAVGARGNVLVLHTGSHVFQILFSNNLNNGIQWRVGTTADDVWGSWGQVTT